MASTGQEIQLRNSDLAPTLSRAYVGSKHLFQRPSQAEWDMLYYPLALKGRGSPIQNPDMQLNYPIEHRMVGYSIGDVILFDTRGFVDFEFNIFVPADSPLNGMPQDIPETFSPMLHPLDPSNVHEDTPFKGHTVLEGQSVRKLKVPGHSAGKIFDAVVQERTALTLPDGMTSRDVIDVSCFRKYIAANAVSWYKSVNEVGYRHATNGDLRIVVGWDHCSSWSRVTSSSIIVHIPNDETTSTSFSRFDGRIGADGTGVLEPMDGDELLNDGAVYPNQSIFLRTLNISVCEDIWSKLAEDFRPRIERFMRPLPAGTPFKWESRFIKMHPANEINALLLKQKPHAKFAITQDSDWISVLKPDDSSLPNADEFLLRILEVYNICEEDDVIFLEYKPQFLYRTYITHDYDPSLTLALWEPTVIAVGAVGYFSRKDDKFITLFNAYAPDDSTSQGIPSLSPVIKISQTMYHEKSIKSKAFGLLYDLLRIGRSSGPPQRMSFPLKVGEKAAHIYTGPSRHRQFLGNDLAMGWFKSNIDKIIEIHGPDHNITRENLVLINGTLDAPDYALFVSACHQEGSVTFDVNLNPQIGQPWGTFLPTNAGQFTGKVSRHGGPWETVLVSCLHVASKCCRLIKI
ncbi:hypothetical protein M413DRAFT_449046, partial [Hebeloma cylindrosporum]